MENDRETFATKMKDLLKVENEEDIELRNIQLKTYSAVLLARAGIMILKLKVDYIGNGPFGKVIVALKSFKKSINANQEIDYWIPPSKISNGDIVGVLQYEDENTYFPY